MVTAVLSNTLSTISAVLIVKNEATHIKRCLDTLCGYDEVVIVDTGSTDGTQDICQLYHNSNGNVYKIYNDYLWNDNFAEARNHALSKATSEWCLSIDADKYMVSTANDVRDILSKLPRIKDDTLCVSVKCISEDESMSFYRPLLFRNNKEVLWSGAVHEYLVHKDGVQLHSQLSEITKVFGYSDSHKQDPNRNLRILFKELENNNKDSRTLFYIMREYWDKRDYDNTLKFAEEFLTVGTWLPEVCEALLIKAKVLWYTEQGTKSREVCTECIKLNPMFAEALRFMSEIHYEPWKSKWLRLSEGCDNSDVLFVRK